MIVNILLVAAGSSAGGVLRYLIALLSDAYPARIPYWTLIVNIVGGLAIGMIVAAAGDSTRARLLLATGFCGGFTTFSAFSLETLRLFESGAAGLALLNVLLNVVLSIAACWAGYALGAGMR